MTLASRLRKLRENSGATLQSAADGTGIRKPHVWALERGATGASNPTLNTLRALSRYYGVTVAYLIGEQS